MHRAASPVTTAYTLGSDQHVPDQLSHPTDTVPVAVEWELVGV